MLKDYVTKDVLVCFMRRNTSLTVTLKYIKASFNFPIYKFMQLKHKKPG